MTDFTVIVNDCDIAGAPGGPIQIRTQNTNYGSRNFMLGYTNLVSGLPRQLTGIELDWMETIGNIFAIDLACKRGKGDVVWARSITAYLPVREPDYWNSVAHRLQNIFRDFTSDRLEIFFRPSKEPQEAPRQRTDSFQNHDCVSLLSGGVDSFVGTAQLIADGHKPLALSHTAAGAISHAQSEVEKVLQVMYADLERLTLTARKTGTFPPTEPSQRSRSMLFLGAASIVASVGGSNTVYINENGVMAIHLPLTTARIGSLSTHTASPAILDGLQGLARDVLGAPIEIKNNLLSLTKPQVVSLGVSRGLTHDLSESVSCWSIGRTGHHCGVCAPCLMRRISFELHNVPDIAYTADAFQDHAILKNDFACDNLTHLVRHIDELQNSSDLELQFKFPELLNGGNQMPIAKAIELHKRWANEAESILSTKSIPQLVR